jgi:hypothetical protein
MNNISNIAIVDSSINVYELNTIISGAESAAEYIFSTEESFTEINNRQQVLAKVRALLSGAFVGTSVNEAAIKALSNSLTTNVKIVGYGEENFLMFNDDNAKTSFVNKFNDVISGYNLRSQCEYIYGYNSTGILNGKTFISKNLLALYNVLSGENSSSLFGFSVTDGTATISRTGADVSVQEDATAPATFGSELMLFPFVGKRLTGSFDLTTAGSGNVASLAFYDDTDAFISRVNFSLSGTGRKSFNATVPANTVYVALEFVLAADELITFSKPMIGLNGNSTFDLL